MQDDAPVPHSGRRPGRPRAAAPAARTAILDTVAAMLHEMSVRQLTMEEVARRAGVGKPTLYRWWPTKTALVVDMFMARLAADDTPTVTPDVAASRTAVEHALRSRVRGLARDLRGHYGQVLADLIAEGQSDPGVLRELYDRKIGLRRASTIALVEQGKAVQLIRSDVDAELLVDLLAGPLYYRLLLQHAPLSDAYADAIVTAVLQTARLQQS